MKLLVVLAAGEGTRLRPLTNEIPKCMVEVDGVPMIDQLLTHFNKWADKIIVVTGYKSEKLVEHISSLNDRERIITVQNERYFETNSMYSAFLTQHLWKDFNEIVLTNSDVLFTKDALSTLLYKRNDITLAVDLKECDLEDMRVSIDPDLDKITSVSKQVPLHLSHGEFTGVAKLKGVGVNRFELAIESLLSDKKMVEKGWYDLVFDHIAKQIQPLSYYCVPPDSYCEIDTLQDLSMVKSKCDEDI